MMRTLIHGEICQEEQNREFLNENTSSIAVNRIVIRGGYLGKFDCRRQRDKMHENCRKI